MSLSKPKFDPPAQPPVQPMAGAEELRLGGAAPQGNTARGAIGRLKLRTPAKK